jgi:hypothetical protein
MALVYNGFPTYRLLAAYLAAAARLGAGATEAARRCSERFMLVLVNGLRDSEHRSSGSRECALRHLPGSVFDARYNGLSAQAAYLDAAICRQERLR